MEGWFAVMCLWLARLMVVFVWGLMALGVFWMMSKRKAA